MSNAGVEYHTERCVLAVTAMVCVACVVGCASSFRPAPPGDTLALALPSSIALASQDGTSAQIGASITRGPNAKGNVTLSAGNLPLGLSATFLQPGTGNSGSVTLQASAAVPAGNYTITISASDGRASSTQNLAVVVAIAATVGVGVDTTQGVNGKLNQFMSTSFQPAEWDFEFFVNHTATEPSQLNTLGSQHIRIQFLSQAIPMKANTGSASDWDFAMLDDVVQPILSVTDHSPEMQIAVAPALPGMLDSSDHLIVNSANLTAFANYCANLVRYYNTGGFTWGGQHFQSPSANKISWWGIFNEYNINGLSPSAYVQLYNTVVPAMLQADPSIKFSALELADFDCCTGDPRVNLPTFVAAPASGGVSAKVDIVSTHFYSSCNQKDTDADLMNSAPAFVSDVRYFYHELQTRADLANVPVWVTENNVNADFSNANGNSTCNPSQKFVTDQRGSSGFFAAWRPYVFSQLGKAGSQAFYHWDYDADAQFGEVDYRSDGKYLSYWVDYWLARMFPAPPGGDILNLSITEASTTETLAVKFADGSVIIMVADRAVHSSSDNNGSGDPRTTIVDISALGNFSSATQLIIDRNTDVVNGPTLMAVTVAPKITLTLGGYGVTFVALKP